MCVPDLLGTQGTFLLFTTRPAGEASRKAALRKPSSLEGDRVETALDGPEHPLPRRRSAAHAAAPCAARSRAVSRRDVEIGGHGHNAHARRVERLGVALVSGRAWRDGVGPYAAARARDGRALLALSLADQPRSREAGDADFASVVLRDLSGEKARAVFATLGLAEDTWALNEGVTDDGRFCSRPTTSTASARTCSSRRSIGCGEAGSSACSTRPTASSTCSGAHLDAAHPAAQGRKTAAQRRRHPRPLPAQRRAGRPRPRALGEDDVLMVISDHGFNSFRRGVNLNRGCCGRGISRSSPAPTAERSGCATWTGRRLVPTPSGSRGSF